VRNWTRRTISSLSLCRKLHSLLGKSTKTAAIRAALFAFNMHQIVYWLGLRPRPHWGSLQRSPDSAVFMGLLLKGGERRGREGRGREGRSSSFALGRKKVVAYVVSFSITAADKALRSGVNVALHPINPVVRRLCSSLYSSWRARVASRLISTATLYAAVPSIQIPRYTPTLLLTHILTGLNYSTAASSYVYLIKTVTGHFTYI